MFRAFVFGVLAAIIVALVGGYFALRNGIIPANADATLRGWKHEPQGHRWTQPYVVRLRIPIPSL
jgi:hypothetical protein